MKQIRQTALRADESAYLAPVGPYMTKKIADYYPWLREAIAELKLAGLGTEASKLEERAFAVFTTSSELHGEAGAAIVDFLNLAGDNVPLGARQKLKACLIEIGRVWPIFKT